MSTPDPPPTTPPAKTSTSTASSERPDFVTVDIGEMTGPSADELDAYRKELAEVKELLQTERSEKQQILEKQVTEAKAKILEQLPEDMRTKYKDGDLNTLKVLFDGLSKGGHLKPAESKGFAPDIPVVTQSGEPKHPPGFRKPDLTWEPV